MTKGSPRLHIRIDCVALSQLRMIAESQGMTLSKFVREIIYAYLYLDI